MITITALKWVPPFAQGQVRDHRARWVLNEVGWPYDVRLLDTEDQQDRAYRNQQPFGQVPILEEVGRPALFETARSSSMWRRVRASFSRWKIIHHADLLDAYPSLTAYRDRCFERLAYKQAIADQCASFAQHSEKDMKYGLKTAS
jgi:glutathione S-transferase